MSTIMERAAQRGSEPDDSRILELEARAECYRVAYRKASDTGLPDEEIDSLFDEMSMAETAVLAIHATTARGVLSKLWVAAPMLADTGDGGLAYIAALNGDHASAAHMDRSHRFIASATGDLARILGVDPVPPSIKDWPETHAAAQSCPFDAGALSATLRAAVTAPATDPVVDYARHLGQAWLDYEKAQKVRCQDEEESEAEAEAWARICAYEAMISITPARTIGGAAVQLCVALADLCETFRPIESRDGKETVRVFEGHMRQIGYALQTIAEAGALDLRAMGLRAYVAGEKAVPSDQAESAA